MFVSPPLHSLKRTDTGHCVPVTSAAFGIFIYYLHQALGHHTDTLLPLFRAQLPRPRIMRALIDASHSSRTASEVPYCPPIIRRSHKFVVDEDRTPMAWMFLDSLEKHCREGKEKYCWRRGCKERAKSSCKDCLLTRYCDKTCQKRSVPSSTTLLSFIANIHFIQILSDRTTQ